jgi:proteasome lid subunit RPN8/RPN11
MGVNGVKNNIKYTQEITTHFKIKKSIYEEMILYCNSGLPKEVCGLLSGKNETGETIWKIQNEALNPNRFYMSTEVLKNAAMKMEKDGEKLSGIFHSHPNSPAFPSSHDIKNNSYYDLAYIIVSFYKGKVEVGCYKMDRNTLFPLELIIIDE